EMAASFFSESFLQQVGLHAQVGIHPLQSSVLFLQSLHLAHHRGIHTAILRTPFVKTGSADAMLPAQLRHRNSAFRLAQHGHDLGFAKSALLHQNLLEHLAEKILLLNPLIRGEDYPASYSTISFDIFDTLITRGYANPVDVFAEVEKRLVDAGFERAEGFAQQRETAEQRARKKHSAGRGAEDISL